MMTMSALEVLGPIMVGPSSSHTAGALRIALAARSLAPDPLVRVEFWLYNSFSHTHRGHGTDQALVAGMLGCAPDDKRVRDSFAIAKEHGLAFDVIEKGDDESLHPNTVEVHMYGPDTAHVAVIGESIGGGRIRISGVNGAHVRMAGDMPTIFVSHHDTPGVLAALTAVLAQQHINVATMRTFRAARGGVAYTIFEIDEEISGRTFTLFRQTPHVIYATQVYIPGAAPAITQGPHSTHFDNGAELLALCESNNFSIGTAMQRREKILRPEADSEKEMTRVLNVMRQEVHDTIEHPRASIGGLLFGQAQATANTSPAIIDALMAGANKSGSLCHGRPRAFGNHGYHRRCTYCRRLRCRTRLHPRRGRAHTRNRQPNPSCAVECRRLGSHPVNKRKCLRGRRRMSGRNRIGGRNERIGPHRASRRHAKAMS